MLQRLYRASLARFLTINTTTRPSKNKPNKHVSRIYSISQDQLLMSWATEKLNMSSIQDPQSVIVCPHAGCGKIFDRAYNLRVHIRKHTGEQPYMCKVQGCNKTFKWRSSLAHHKNLHKSKGEISLDYEIKVAPIIAKSTVEKPQSGGAKVQKNRNQRLVKLRPGKPTKISQDRDVQMISPMVNFGSQDELFKIEQNTYGNFFIMNDEHPLDLETIDLDSFCDSPYSCISETTCDKEHPSLSAETLSSPFVPVTEESSCELSMRSDAQDSLSWLQRTWEAKTVEDAWNSIISDALSK